MANPSFAFGGDQTVYPSRGINQGIGIGYQTWDDKPCFALNLTVQGTPIGTPPGLPLQGRVTRSGATWNKAFRYVQVARGGGLPPDSESMTNPGFYNRTGVLIPQGKYFWAIQG